MAVKYKRFYELNLSISAQFCTILSRSWIKSYVPNKYHRYSIHILVIMTMWGIWHFQNWNLCQFYLKPLMIIDSKVQKILWTKPFSLRPILYHFVSVMNKIFCPTQISQILNSHPCYYDNVRYLTFQIWNLWQLILKL